MKPNTEGIFQSLNPTLPCPVMQAMEMVAAFPAAATDLELLSVPQLQGHDRPVGGPAHSEPLLLRPFDRFQSSEFPSAWYT